VVDLLKNSFVAFALDNASVPNVTAAEAVWLHDVGPGRYCTQGMGVFTAGGKMLGQCGGYQAPGNIKMLKDALSKYKPEETVDIEDPHAAVPPGGPGKGYPREVPRPVKDGLVLFVSFKVLGGLPDKPDPGISAGGIAYYSVWKRMLGVDRIWAGKAEAAALARGDFPDKLKERLAIHVAYVMGSAVKLFDLRIRDRRLSGSILLRNGESCDLLGLVEAADGKLSRFELIIKGVNAGPLNTDSMAAGPLTVKPKGKVDVGLAFMRVDPKDELARVRPLAARDLRGGEEK